MTRTPSEYVFRFLVDRFVKRMLKHKGESVEAVADVGFSRAGKVEGLMNVPGRVGGGIDEGFVLDSVSCLAGLSSSIKSRAKLLVLPRLR